MCPLSNLKLKVVTDLKDHPLKKLLDAGVVATINSDDPAYFGGYVRENFVATQEALNLTDDELATLAKNSFEASFIPDEEKAKYKKAIDYLLEQSQVLSAH